VSTDILTVGSIWNAQESRSQKILTQKRYFLLSWSFRFNKHVHLGFPAHIWVEQAEGQGPEKDKRGGRSKGFARTLETFRR